MNKKFLRDGFEYYLEIDTEGGEEYEYQMLLVNHMESILPVNVVTVEDKRQLVYSASGYKTLDNCLEKMVINGEQILLVMESVLNGVEDIKRYLLAPNNLVLSSDCLFVETDYSKVGLIYVPGYDKDIIVQLRELMETLLGRINSSDINSVMLAWKLYTLIKDDHISLREIRKIMAGYKENGVMFPARIEEPGEPLEVQPEYREVKRTLTGKKREVNRKWLPDISFPLAVSLICMAVLVISEIVILVLIYTEGILLWKRNLFLLLTLLLVLNIGITITLWKKDQVVLTLRTLQERAKEHLTFS